MEKLEEFDNLVNAMGALFYASKRMTTQVPCVFEAWKDFVFERQAGKIHELLSSGNRSLQSPGKSEIKSFEVTSKNATGGPHMLSDNAVSPLLAGNTPSELQKQQTHLSNLNYLESLSPHTSTHIQDKQMLKVENEEKSNVNRQSPISNSGVTEGENDYDEYFDSGEVEEYIQVKDSEHSCHILPVSNTKYNSGDSQFEDDEVASVVEEEEDDNETPNQPNPRERHECEEDGPELENAKLLMKHA